MGKKKYVMFDWAAKTILRDKTNFKILEGFVQVLTGQEIHIEEILESESNQKDDNDKFNRVDIKAKDTQGDIIIVEIQLTRELYFLQRLLYGVAKSLTEHINLGDSYEKIKKVISISVLYFDLGKGSDYLYHGQTVFTGVNTRDELQITIRERTAIELKTPADIFPEYYIVRVNEFNGALADTPLEEWLGYLKTGEIQDDAKAPGLQEARRKLEYMKMSDKEKARYEYHLDAINTQLSVLEANRREGRYDGFIEGRAEGKAEGRAEGKAEGRAEAYHEMAQRMKKEGANIEMISRCTGLSIEEIHKLQ